MEKRRDYSVVRLLEKRRDLTVQRVGKRQDLTVRLSEIGQALPFFSALLALMMRTQFDFLKYRLIAYC